MKSKGEKFETVLDSAFATGRLWISSVHDEYIKTFIDQWISWDGGLQRSRTGHDDALDGTYILSLAAQGQIMHAPAPGVKAFERRKGQSMLAGLQNHRGY